MTPAGGGNGWLAGLGRLVAATAHPGRPTAPAATAAPAPAAAGAPTAPAAGGSPTADRATDPTASATAEATATDRDGSGTGTAAGGTDEHAGAAAGTTGADGADESGAGGVGERADRPLEEALEEVVLGAPRRYTRQQLVDAAGLDGEEGRRLRRALGFAEVPEDAVLFNDRDVAAIRLMGSLTDAGVLPPDVREAVARATAQAMSRLAEWQVGMLRRLVESGGEPLTEQESLQVAGAVLPALEELQDYVWRRHLVAAIGRLLVASRPPGDAAPVDPGPPDAAAGGTGTGGQGTDGTETLVVGFADMVGFTRTTRRRSVAELSEMIERFGASTTDVIAEGNGRIVKTVGDEVLFVADAVADGAEIALALRERVRREPVLTQLRIGLAAGPVLVRFGDVYGEVVNIASRLTGHARPDSVLVDRVVAEALAGDGRYTVRPLKALTVRGYRHLHPWLLDRGPGGDGRDPVIGA